MTTEPDNQQSNDDQELANALAGISDQPVQTATDQPTTGLAFEETPVGQSGAVSDAPFSTPLPTVPGAPAPSAPVVSQPTTAPSNPQLDGIKKDALNELRPLVDKLNVPAEEKFDTYLLLLRSTDDTTLIGPAHQAAREIPDEARRAQALLDIIKEIDYLSAEQK